MIDNEGNTQLMCACIYPVYKTTKEEGNIPLKQTETLKLIKSELGHVNIYGNTALIWACFTPFYISNADFYSIKK